MQDIESAFIVEVAGPQEKGIRLEILLLRNMIHTVQEILEHTQCRFRFTPEHISEWIELRLCFGEGHIQPIPVFDGPVPPPRLYSGGAYAPAAEALRITDCL